MEEKKFRESDRFPLWILALIPPILQHFLYIKKSVDRQVSALKLLLVVDLVLKFVSFVLLAFIAWRI